MRRSSALRPVPEVTITTTTPSNLRGDGSARGGSAGDYRRANPITQASLDKERRQEEERRGTGATSVDVPQSESEPSGPIWRSARDPVSGRIYYFDLVSQRSQWAKPPEVAYTTERRLAREASAESDTRKFFREMERNIYRKLSRLPRAMIERRPGAVARRLVRSVGRGGLKRGVEGRSLAHGAFRQPPPSPIQAPQKGLDWKRGTRAATSAFVKFVPSKKGGLPAKSAIAPATGPPKDGVSIQELSKVDYDKSPDGPEHLEGSATLLRSIPGGHRHPAADSAVVTPCLQRPRSDCDMTSILVNFATVYRNRILVASEAARGANCSASPVSVDQLQEGSFVFSDAYGVHDCTSRNVGDRRDDDDSSGDGAQYDSDSSLDNVQESEATKDPLDNSCRHGAAPMQISSSFFFAMSPICTHASCSTDSLPSCCPPHQAVLDVQKLWKTPDKPSEPPSVREVLAVLNEIFTRGQLEDEAVAITLIYVDRLSQMTRGRVHPSVHNWKSILVVSMILASKVWDDLSMSNGDFASVCESWVAPPVSAATSGSAMSTFTLRRINQLERAALTCLDFDVSIHPAQFELYDCFLRVKAPRGYGKMKTLPKRSRAENIRSGKQHGGATNRCSLPFSWTQLRTHDSWQHRFVDRYNDHHTWGTKHSADFRTAAMRRTKSI